MRAALRVFLLLNLWTCVAVAGVNVIPTNLVVTLTAPTAVTAGSPLPYTLVISNAGTATLQGLQLNLALDPNTSLVAGSLNTSPLAFDDTFAAIGNVSLNSPAPGLLANDVDLDGVGPALVVSKFDAVSSHGGQVSVGANGGFSYDPPPGFEGTDTFSYTIDDGEGFTDTARVSIVVAGAVWFVKADAPPGGDGRIKTPFKSLASFAAINNGSPTGGRAGHSVFLYSGNYAGPLTLLPGQRLIGQGATESLLKLSELALPTGSLLFPLTGLGRPVIGLGQAGVTLSANNVVRGLNFNTTGGAIKGGGVGSLNLSEVSVSNQGGTGVSLVDGTLNVTLDSVTSQGGDSGIRIQNCTGQFTVTGDGANSQNASGGTIQGTTDHAVFLDGAMNVSLSRMRILGALGSGIAGQNVNGLVIDWCLVSNNGDNVGEGGIRLGQPTGGNGLIGTAAAGSNPTRLSNTTIQRSAEMNVAIYNEGGVLSQLDVQNVILSDTRLGRLGADGFLFEARGNASANLSFIGCTFSNNVTQGLQASALAQSTVSVNVAGSSFINNNEGVVLLNGVNGHLNFTVEKNRFLNTLPLGTPGVFGTAIAAVNATTVTPQSTYQGRILNNLVSGGGVDNHLIAALFAGSGNNTLIVSGNNVDAPNAQFSGIFVQAGETGSGPLNANVLLQGNTVKLGSLGSHGIVVQSRVTANLCADILGNVSTTGGVGLSGINVRQRDASAFHLPGFGGKGNVLAQVAAFVGSKNPASTIGVTLNSGFLGGTPCISTLLAPTLSNASPDFEKASPTSQPPPSSLARADSPRQERLNLTEAQLHATVDAAREIWKRSGLSPTQLSIIERLRFDRAQLGGWTLGESSLSGVRLDLSASGYGWFVDVDGSATSVPAGRMDLLTVVVHEMGHQLGLLDEFDPSHSNRVMQGILLPGQRRLPVAGEAQRANLAAMPRSGHQVAAVNIPTLPPGKRVTVLYGVKVNTPLPKGVCSLSSQATVQMTGAPSVLSDDPRTAVPFDPTLTALSQPPQVATLPATAVTITGATLNGTVNSCGVDGIFYFEYGSTTAYGLRTSAGAVVSGASDMLVNSAVGALPEGVVQHFRLVASNAFGTNFGIDRTFVTVLGVQLQPQSVVACVGDKVTFKAAADVPTASYRWQRRLPGSTAFLNLPGASLPSFTTLAVKPSDDGTAYRVVMSTDAAHTTSDEAFLSVVTVTSPFVTATFSNGVPAHVALYGDAAVDPVAKILELNPVAGARAGALLTADPAPGRFVTGFSAIFKARVSADSAIPADGFSFNWAGDLPHGPYAMAEEGEGSGLSVAFDTYDNGGGEAPAIDVLWQKKRIAHKAVPVEFLVRGNTFFDVAIRVSPEGLLDLSYACNSVFARLPIPGFVSQRGARFGLGSRTGALSETHGIDDLAIEVMLDPTNGLPRIDSVALLPGKGLVVRGHGSSDPNLILESSVDLKSWTWRGYVTPNADGLWEFIETDLPLGPERFYRLRSLFGFPAGVLDHYDADRTFIDSVGPNSGTPVGGIDFGPGQRGDAFLFNTMDRLITMNGDPVPPPWSLSVWVKRGVTTDASASLVSDPATAVKLEQWPNTHALGLTQFGVADYYFKYVTPVDTWTHLTLVAVSGSTQLYVNGTVAETQLFSVNLPRKAIGGRPGDRLIGSVDDLTLFGRALTPEEVQKLYSITRGP